MKPRKFPIVLLFGMLFLAGVCSARADFTLTVTDVTTGTDPNTGLALDSYSVTSSSGNFTNTGTTTNGIDFSFAGTVTTLSSGVINLDLGGLASLSANYSPNFDLNGNTIRDSFVVTLSATDFAAPNGGATLSSGASATVSGDSGTSDALAFQVFLDPHNSGDPTGTTPGAQTATISTDAPGDFLTPNPARVGGLDLSPPFSLAAQWNFDVGTDANGLNVDSVSVDGSARLAPVPVPPGIVMVLSGLPMLGLNWWARRRRGLAAA